MSETLTKRCVCCDTALKSSSGGPQLVLWRCPSCGTFEAEHLQSKKSAEPWDSVDVSPTFLTALAERRHAQAVQIGDRFCRFLQKGKVLDYGCGQGDFVKLMAGFGFDIQGCDVSQQVKASILLDRFIPLSRPWSLPSPFHFETVALLDVLEHHATPESFLRQFQDAGVRRFLIKIPLATGPIFWIASFAAQIGFPTMMEKLFLVGDVYPHTHYYSGKGLRLMLSKLKFRQIQILTLAEIGRELPRRIRALPSGWKALSFGLGFVGLFFEWISPIWSDTGVFAFERDS